ncbi:amino acid ABC transporter permease [Leuconostoc litchii]|uniref:Amino acid ABC transporter permease n=1 Tax=Leuconostoc litchii TaxID=1981069 RepID=A0A6P2CME8_9LACO|nr:amino acid ABC transporter permease [Leuconostoc litchii]TYC46097.1 amino acid ABC transporter permease [Leuconostoc litchii]GMA69819.1 amino acid ABC transporter permease [Leuconostoc litchii]
MQILAISTIFEGNNLLRLLSGLFVTIEISVISIFIGTVLGLILGSLWTTGNHLIQPFFKLYLEIFRVVPTIPLLFLFYYIFPRNLNINLSSMQVSILVFSLWFAAEFSDIVRGAIQSISKNQRENAYTIGLSMFQTYRYVLVPQSIPNILPAFINLSTRIIKTTSILLLISVTDVITVGQQIIEANAQDTLVPLLIYALIALFYFLINFLLSQLSQRLERKFRKYE